MKNEVRKKDLLFANESYEIMGVLFGVSSDLGFGYREEQYKKAIEIGLKEKGFDIRREVPVKLTFQDKFLTTNYLDFLVNNSIVLEIKQGDFFTRRDLDQLYNYLRATNLKLGILARFTRSGIKYKRVVNLS